MGKIIKDGFAFMEYANAGLLRKVDDIPELKTELIALGEEKSHLQMSQYALLLAEHVLSMSGTVRTPEIENCFSAAIKWQKGEAKFQAGRDAAGVMNDLARGEKDKIKVKVFRFMAQVAATPHVRWHALAASEFAVVIINLMFPGEIERVRKEREYQIDLLKNI